MKNILTFIRLKLSFLNPQSAFFSTEYAGVSSMQGSIRKTYPSFPFFKNRNIKIPRGAILVIGLIVIAAIFILVVKGRHASTASQSTSLVPQIQGPLATEKLNKEFTFPVSDSAAGATTTSRISYDIQSAELRKQILLKGEPADAITGRVFMVLNLKIANKETHGIQIRTRDFVRLSVNGSQDLLAPDIHNDPVEVQAISTKYTRIGFIINDTDKNLVLQIGSIDGIKQKVPLKFK